MVFVALPSVPLYLKSVNIASLITSATFFIAMIISTDSSLEQNVYSHAIFIARKSTEHMSKMVAQ
jgi:hypothetical protein